MRFEAGSRPSVLFLFEHHSVEASNRVVSVPIPGPHVRSFLALTSRSLWTRRSHTLPAPAPLCRGVSWALRSTTCVLASSVLNKWHHRALTLLLRAGNIQWCLRTLRDTFHSTSRGKRTFVSVPIAWPPARSPRRSANLITSDQLVTHGARASAPLCRGVSMALRSTTCVLASSVLDKWHHRALTLLLRAGIIRRGSANSARLTSREHFSSEELTTSLLGTE